MAEFFSDYGLFLAKALTVLVVAVAIAVLVVAVPRRQPRQRLEVTNLNDRYERLRGRMREAMTPTSRLQRWKPQKQRRRGEPARRRVFVLNFQGDIQASALASLREEVTAVLGVARANDEVVVRLESFGGLVHDYGLATSQLLRIKEQGIPLTIVIDKIAASGGYMMACVADKLLAAPFAVVGSVGVVAQIPNVHRWLDEHGVAVEQFKAGEDKRTVTVLGKNTVRDREKLKHKLDETHDLFRKLVAEQRPQVDIVKVGTGDHWYGQQAVELNLIDDLATSDEYLLRTSDEADVYEVNYRVRQPVTQRLSAALQGAIARLLPA